MDWRGTISILMLFVSVSAQAGDGSEEFNAYMMRFARQVSRLAIEGEARDRFQHTAEGYRVAARSADDVRRDLKLLLTRGLVESDSEKRNPLRSESSIGAGHIYASLAVGGAANLAWILAAFFADYHYLIDIPYEYAEPIVQYMFLDPSVAGLAIGATGGVLTSVAGVYNLMKNRSREAVLQLALVPILIGVVLYGHTIFLGGEVGAARMWFDMIENQSFDVNVVALTLPAIVGATVSGTLLARKLVPFLREHGAQIRERMHQVAQFWSVVQAEGRLTPQQLTWAKTNVGNVVKSEKCRLNLERVNVRVADELLEIETLEDEQTHEDSRSRRGI